MDKQKKKFAEMIKNRLVAELSDETLNMIWGWQNKVENERCACCEKAGRIDLLKELIDECSRDAEAHQLVNEIMIKLNVDSGRDNH